MKTFLRKQDDDNSGSTSFGRLSLRAAKPSVVQNAQRASPLSPGANKPTRQFADMVLAPVDPTMLEALEAKTKGNLDASEIALLSHLLWDLRMAYVEARRKA